MIVKNGAASLVRCLESVSGLVDRIVLGDTGSTDDSVAIARSFGAEILPIPWQNDFAHARNRVLEHSRCDWILVLDADEMLDVTAQTLLPEAIAHPDLFAYDLWRWNYVHTTNTWSGDQAALPNPFLVEASRPYPAYVRSRSTRLFRRHSDIRFTRPVHEDVAESIRSLGLAHEFAPFVIHHFGQVEDPHQTRHRKNDLYGEIGRQHLLANPTDVRTHVELGWVELAHRRDPATAFPLFSQAAQLNPRNADAWLFTGICLVRLNRCDEALAPLAHAEALAPNSTVLHEALGDAHFQRADYAPASQSYARAQTLGATCALIDAKHGCCEILLGHPTQGLERVVRAIQREPDFAELYDFALVAAQLARKPKIAALIALRRTALGNATAQHFLRAAELCASTGDPDRAHSLLRRGLVQFPDDPALLAALQQPPSPSHIHTDLPRPALPPNRSPIPNA
jgi:tetratricopeptide (TPR) repeat protein